VEELTVCTWLWGDKYPQLYIERLAESVARRLKQPHQFRVFTPEADDQHLTQIPGCFARLRMFDPAWQEANGFRGRLVCLDLDLVVTGPLDSLFDRPEPFVILQGVNASNPCPYNGSAMMLRAGAHPEVWSDFNLEAVKASAAFEFHDDQGWLHHKVPGAAGWGPGDGVYGWRDPIGFQHLPWVQEHWRT
jgi:hypothetical protein